MTKEDEIGSIPYTSNNTKAKEITIEFRSTEVQEILKRPPHALVRYGISLICSVFLLLFIGGFFFKYPDIVTGDIVITTENPPIWLVAKSSGKIKDLLCSDKQIVNQGVLLAVIDNSASTIDVQKINQLLSIVQISDSSLFIPGDLFLTSYELGELQSPFSSFTKTAMNYENFISLNLINQEKNSLHKQIIDRNIYSSNLRLQLEIEKKELQIVISDYQRKKLLFEHKVISALEMETSEQIYLSKQQELQQLETSISLEKVQSSQLKGSASKLSMQYQFEKNQLLSELKSSFRELKAAIENWQQLYLLIAPQTGVISFNSFWKQNQYINSGNKVFAIISHNPGKFIGKIKVPVLGSGKVQIGQIVNIKIVSFPYMEYGVLEGITTNISLVPNDSFYNVEVELTKGLFTSIKKELNFTGELSGTAEIVTENKSIIERISAPMQYLAKKFF